LVEEEGAVREWGFLLVARVGREEEGAGRKGDIYGQRNSFIHY
jgi:hypothetical protein